jgi:hypothetical protein
MRRSAFRLGFTMVELLVVISMGRIGAGSVRGTNSPRTLLRQIINDHLKYSLRTYTLYGK